jgi:undecaprenyl phosphate-alpha-L-ara4N flippase subunit ArnE
MGKKVKQPRKIKEKHSSKTFVAASRIAEEKKGTTTQYPRSAYFLVFVVIAAIVSGQIILRCNLSTLYFPKNWTIYELANMTVRNLLNPYVIASLFMTMVAGLVWILVIQKIPLSRAYPMISLNYVTICTISWLVFGEPFSLVPFVSVAFIVIGTMLLGMR